MAALEPPSRVRVTLYQYRQGCPLPRPCGHKLGPGFARPRAHEGDYQRNCERPKNHRCGYLRGARTRLCRRRAALRSGSGRPERPHKPRTDKVLGGIFLNLKQNLLDSLTSGICKQTCTQRHSGFKPESRWRIKSAMTFSLSVQPLVTNNEEIKSWISINSHNSTS